MIKKIKWKNHIFLGNLELDFTKPDGTAYNTIILAGENGTGKTTILETLCTFLDLYSFEPFDYIEYEVNNTLYKIEPMSQDANLGFHKRINVTNGNSEGILRNRYNDVETLKNDTEDIRSYGISYSRARSGFKTNPIKSSTTQQTDSDKYETDKSDDYTQAKQLLIDIKGQDNELLDERVISNNGMTPRQLEIFKKDSKTYRFEKAFNDFFDDIKFKGVKSRVSDEIRIVFEKHGREISIDELSTGEKQIVFRGTQLLKNSQIITGGIVLIDEPELSMHPRWQKKILKYYRDLFTNNENQSVQMIIATHSAYVIQAALEEKDNILVVVLSDNNGTIDAEKVITPGVLPGITPAETNYLAFKVPTTDYHIELYGWLQRKNGDLSVKQCDDYIVQQAAYDSTKHGKASSFTDKNGYTTNYQTLPTYIRNAIDHPDPNRTFTDEQLEASIELLRQLC